MLALVLAGTALCGPSQAAQPLGAETFARDMEQTILCRRVLFEDPVLGPLNIGVRVRNGVATLWGPVPSPQVGRRAEECLRTLIEVMEVRNETYWEFDFDWSAPGGNPGVPLILPEALPPIMPEPIRRPILPRLLNPPSEVVWR